MSTHLLCRMLADGLDRATCGLDPVASLQIAKLAAAAAAGEGLPPEARPPLLRLLHRYRVATEADVAVWLAAAAAAAAAEEGEAAVPAAAAQTTILTAAAAAAAAAEHAAAASDTRDSGTGSDGSSGCDNDSDSSCADTEIVEDAYSNKWQSPWAQPLALTLTALAGSLATDVPAAGSGTGGDGVGGSILVGDVDGAASGSGSSGAGSGGSSSDAPAGGNLAGPMPDSTEAALLAGALSLISHQATSACKSVRVDADISAGILVSLSVVPPGNVLQQQLLSRLGEGVAAGAQQLAAAPCGCPSFGAQAAALARLTSHAADAADVCWQHRGAWCSDAAAAAATWREWGNHLAVGLQQLAGRLEKDAAGDAGAEFAVLRAAANLESACEVCTFAK